MLAKTESVALVGTEARLVEVEVHVGTGVPAFRIVGLPAKSVTEAEQRTRAALLSSEQRWPPHRITANLAPGALRKEGTHFDLALALGILAADERLPIEPLDGWLVMGELALDGSVRPIRGALAAAICCREQDRTGIVLPVANAPEAAVIDGVRVVPVQTLTEAIRFFKGDWSAPAALPRSAPTPESVEDLAEVRGQGTARTAMEVAAAGGHNLVFMGPPGSGKTMLARRLPGILPAMSIEEAIEVTRIHSIAGLLPERCALVTTRPFRSPHPNISVAGLVGGGAGLAHPGEITLAHHGVLFLDELTLFRRDVLDSLRAPMEEGVIHVARSGGVVSLPASFFIAAAMNPCFCGYANDSRRACSCSELQMAAYRGRLSGPFMDRFDLQVLIGRPTRQELLGSGPTESSAAVRERVEKARLVQAERFGSARKTNGNVSTKELQIAELSDDAREVIGGAVDQMLLSGRGAMRVLRVARTIADLKDSSRVRAEHVSDAINLHFIDGSEAS